MISIQIHFSAPYQPKKGGNPRFIRSGVHHKKANCESTAVISKVQQVLKFASQHLYPEHLTLTVTAGNKKQTKLRKGNGGWGDLRDQKLCINMTRDGR
jgi:alpha-1,6-mannosyl-glycoprotein beta-1,2-N-acetylglucosaminyltransferase